MKISHFGITIEIPKFTFGDQRDILIRDEMVKMTVLIMKSDKARKPVARFESKVKEHMRKIEGYINMKTV